MTLNGQQQKKTQRKKERHVPTSHRAAQAQKPPEVDKEFLLLFYISLGRKFVYNCATRRCGCQQGDKVQ